MERIISMDRTTIGEAVSPDCPIRNIPARLCDKWPLLVIYTLDKAAPRGAIRFKELRRAIPDISQKMPAVALRTLEEDGYATRTVCPEVPPRVEYAPTGPAYSLLPHTGAPTGWALKNKDAVIRDRKAACGDNEHTKRGERGEGSPIAPRKFRTS